MKTLDELLERYEKRYLTSKKVKHIMLDSYTLVDTNMISHCGIVERKENWRGTGTQEEHETVAELPFCKNCLRIMGLP